MNKKLYLTLSAACLLGLASCGEGESSGTDSNTDTTTTAENTEEAMPIEEEAGLTFDGVSKGDYMLYGYREIEACLLYTSPSPRDA